MPLTIKKIWWFSDLSVSQFFSNFTDFFCIFLVVASPRRDPALETSPNAPKIPVLHYEGTK